MSTFKHPEISFDAVSRCKFTKNASHGQTLGLICVHAKWNHCRGWDFLVNFELFWRFLRHLLHNQKNYRNFACYKTSFNNTK